MKTKIRRITTKEISYHISEARTSMLKNGDSFIYHSVVEDVISEVRRRLNLRGRAKRK